MNAKRQRIILCADDYGMTLGINRAIRELIALGSLNATSVMMPGAACDRNEIDALKAAADSSHCEIGLHVTLTAPFHPLTPHFMPLQSGAFLPLGKLMRASLLRRLDVAILRSEIDAQLAAFMTVFGRPPDFVDGHQHVQLFPQIRDAFLQAVNHATPDAWVRQCGRRSSSGGRKLNLKALILDTLSTSFRARAARAGLRTNPAFAGAYDWTRPIDFGKLVAGFIDGMPEGGVMMCHPGYVDDELRQIDGLTDMREAERAFLASQKFQELLSAHHLTLS